MQVAILKIGLITLSLIGFWGVTVISYSHWADELPCPTIGSIPACYIIFVGYGLIFLSVLLTGKSTLRLFLAGWIPVIALALVGVIGEITGVLACPSSEIGVPKCYFSGVLSLTIGCLYWRCYKITQ